MLLKNGTLSLSLRYRALDQNKRTGWSSARRSTKNNRTEDLLLWRGALGCGGLLAGTRRRQSAANGVPRSLQIPPPTHKLSARSPAPTDLLFLGAPILHDMFRSDGSNRSNGQRNQPSHSTVLARPLCPFACVCVVQCAPASPYIYPSPTQVSR